VKKLAAVAALSGVFISFNAMAWGSDGHRAVGAIADQLLKGSNAQKQVTALLQPGESLEKIANWADCVKGTFCGPQSDEMVAYAAANPKHIEYHYTDVPFQLPHYQDHGVGTTDHDIVQILRQAIAVLQGKGDEADNPHHFTPRQALLVLTHLVGDIHQPLHVGAAYVGRNGGYVLPQTPGQIDAVEMFNAHGGNNLLLDDVKLGAISAQLIPPALPKEDAVKPATQAPPRAPQTTRPFHSYWDISVVDYAFRRIGARSPEQFARMAIAGKPLVPANTGDAISWPYQWADDALAVSRQAYDGVTVGQVSEQTSSKGEKYKVWVLSMPDNYPLPSSSIAKEQLIKGGYHLAAILQAIWP
jgi:hypothetical protein